MILFKDESYKLDLGVIDRHGDYKSGLTVTYKIKKSSDNSLFASGTMVEVGSTGIYQTAEVTFSLLDKYRIEYTTPNKYENEIEEILITQLSTGTGDVWDELVAGSGSGTFRELLLRIVGLSQENYRIFNPVYDQKSNLISAMIKIYSLDSDVDTDTNSIAQYSINAVHNNKNEMTSYKVKKIV